MNRKPLIAAALLALAATTSAFAGGEYDPLSLYAQPATASTLTRADVKAELARARAAGELRADHDERLFQRAETGSTRTRAEVKAELAQAIADGSIAEFNTRGQYARAPKVESTLTRQQVREEALTALRSRRSAGESGS